MSRSCLVHCFITLPEIFNLRWLRVCDVVLNDQTSLSAADLTQLTPCCVFLAEISDILQLRFLLGNLDSRIL